MVAGSGGGGHLGRRPKEPRHLLVAESLRIDVVVVAATAAVLAPRGDHAVGETRDCGSCCEIMMVLRCVVVNPGEFDGGRLTQRSRVGRIHEIDHEVPTRLAKARRAGLRALRLRDVREKKVIGFRLSDVAKVGVIDSEAWTIVRAVHVAVVGQSDGRIKSDGVRRQRRCCRQVRPHNEDGIARVGKRDVDGIAADSDRRSVVFGAAARHYDGGAPSLHHAPIALIDEHPFQINVVGTLARIHEK